MTFIYTTYTVLVSVQRLLEIMGACKQTQYTNIKTAWNWETDDGYTFSHKRIVLNVLNAIKNSKYLCPYV